MPIFGRPIVLCASLRPTAACWDGSILAGILSPAERTEQVDVLNGIAYDVLGNRLFVTGKLWPKLFEIKLVPLHRKSR